MPAKSTRVHTPIIVRRTTESRITGTLRSTPAALRPVARDRRIVADPPSLRPATGPGVRPDDRADDGGRQIRHVPDGTERIENTWNDV